MSQKVNGIRSLLYTHGIALVIGSGGDRSSRIDGKNLMLKSEIFNDFLFMHATEFLCNFSQFFAHCLNGFIEILKPQHVFNLILQLISEPLG